jgi:hypothetical protein
MAMRQRNSMHAYKVRPREDKRGFDVISDVLPRALRSAAAPSDVMN